MILPLPVCVFSLCFGCTSPLQTKLLAVLIMNIFSIFIRIFFCHRANFALVCIFQSFLNEARDFFQLCFGWLFFSSPTVVFVAVCSFSSCGEQGLLSSCGVQVSHCSGFSSCAAQLWVHGPQQLWHMGLVALQHVGSSEIEPLSPKTAGKFLTPGPPGKFMFCFSLIIYLLFYRTFP